MTSPVLKQSVQIEGIGIEIWLAPQPGRIPAVPLIIKFLPAGETPYALILPLEYVLTIKDRSGLDVIRCPGYDVTPIEVNGLYTSNVRKSPQSVRGETVEALIAFPLSKEEASTLEGCFRESPIGGLLFTLSIVGGVVDEAGIPGKEHVHTLRCRFGFEITGEEWDQMGRDWTGGGGKRREGKEREGKGRGGEGRGRFCPPVRGDRDGTRTRG